MNTFSPVIAYLFRCNTDLTSLLSGTAIKAVLAYISDYITKPTLKTYVVFDTIVSVFEKNSDMLHGTVDPREAACHMLTQIVNSLTAKMEIGALMAAMYLLGNPDHYTDHKFHTFYWRSYVLEARRPWQMDTDSVKYDKVAIRNLLGEGHYWQTRVLLSLKSCEYSDVCSGASRHQPDILLKLLN